MADEELVRILKEEGAEAWNAYFENRRNEDSEWMADLRGAKLSGSNLSSALLFAADLSDADLSNADLSSASFVSSNLSGANLSGANLSGALLFTADLSDADLSNADVSDAHLYGANLGGADLDHTDLSGADLHGAKLGGTKLLHANLSGARLPVADLRLADLRFADLSGADLRLAHLAHADLAHADLSGADVRRTIGLELDSCRVKDTFFDFRAREPWNRLRIRYTGAAFIFNLALLALFIAPYLFRAAVWVGVNKGQESMVQSAWALQDAARAIEVSDPLGAERLKETALRLSNLKPCLAKKCEQRPIWHLILGLDKGPGYVSMVALLVLYNICRALLTWRVAPLREAEERSSATPAKDDYWGLHLIDKRLVTPLAYGAIAAGLINAYIWLVLETVWIPV